MSDFVKTIAITGLIGAATAGLLVVPSFLPAAIADEQPMKTLLSSSSELFPAPFDMKSLAKYNVTFDDSVSTEVSDRQTVTKIGYGRKEVVTIVTTPTGTYSSDAITSPYVQYPGIEVEEKPLYRLLDRLSSRFGSQGWVPLYHGSIIILLAGDEDL